MDVPVVVVVPQMEMYSVIVVTEKQVLRVDRHSNGAATVLYEGVDVRRAVSTPHGAAIALADGRIAIVESGGTTFVSSSVQEPIASVLCLRQESNGDPMTLILGTDDGARLYRLVGDCPAVRVASFDDLPCRPSWHTPWGGPPAVRSLAQSADGWIYADVHVGSIMRSPDAGTSWEPVTPSLNEDVHEVVTCPADVERVYSNTANGVYISLDRGDSWCHRSDGLSARYGRAIAVDPHDPDHLLATVSDGPHAGNGKLYRSDDSGRSWAHVSNGFPETTEDNRDTAHVAITSSGSAWAAVGDVLYEGSERTSKWHFSWRAPGSIRQILT
jgi:hypothetical protein